MQGRETLEQGRQEPPGFIVECSRLQERRALEGFPLQDKILFFFFFFELLGKNFQV